MNRKPSQIGTLKLIIKGKYRVKRLPPGTASRALPTRTPFPSTFVRPMPWHREITRQQWRTLVAAQLGWMLDAMDFMLYSSP